MPDNIFSLNTTLIVLVAVVAVVLALNVIAAALNIALRLIIKAKGL